MRIETKKIIIAILIFTALTRLIRIDYPNKYVFDEVYHAFTAKEYLAGHKEAWEWWTTPPPGVAYEWTHPPVAKEIMAFSMLVLHNTNAWAYRFPGALLGILSVYLVYLLTLKLLNNSNASLIAAFLFSLDGLNFVQSRTGMNDIYFVAFELTSLLLLLNKRFLYSAIFFGLALSSKWASIYLLFIIGFLIFKHRGFKELLYFIFIPPLVYLLSYLPFFVNHSFDQFIQLQQQMWWYHTNLKATHAYSSPWWSWPLNLYPVWYFVDYQKNNIANIFATGNSMLFWSGSIAIVATLIEFFKKRTERLFIIILGFIAFWLPWAFSPRIMFLYHFCPSVPFLSIALGYQLNKLLEYSEGRRLALLIIFLIALNFIFLFPTLTGIPLPRSLVNLFFLTNLSKNPFGN